MKVCSRHKALKDIQKYLPSNPVILEAGAYKGHDSLYMARLWPNAQFHLFEPMPELMTALRNNTQSIAHTQYWQVALSDTTGLTEFHVAEKKERPGVPTQAGSVLKPKERIHHSPIIYPNTQIVPTITLDAWAEQNKINQIDFLWLDVQGHELAVLKHATRILKTARVLFVELHFINAYESQPLAQEIIDWLDTHDFSMIARDYTDTTKWFFGNGFFIKKELL